MAQVINTNIASLTAQRNLNSSQAGSNQAMERLSSGLRINSAKDDAAGLAISTRFQSQINGMNVAIRNAGDGVSLAQTAEGALGSMTDSLQRVRELALQAANGTNSAANREALNAEAQQLLAEISRAGAETNFNGLNLLDGSFDAQFQVGANAGETIGVKIGKLTADTLGVSAKSGVSSTATGNQLNVGDLVINGVTVGASRASDDTASTADASASAISKAAAINRVSAESGVTAIVDENVVAGSVMDNSDVSAGTISLNGVDIDIETTKDAASSRAAVVSAINARSAETGVTAIDTGDDRLGVTLVAADGRNISLAADSDGTLTAASTGLALDTDDAENAQVYTGGFTLVANSGVNSIDISGSDVANAGLAAGSYTAGISVMSSSSQVAVSSTSAIIIGEAVAIDDTVFTAAADTMTLTVDGVQVSINLGDSTIADNDALVSELNGALDASALESGAAVASINEDGNLIITSGSTGSDSTITIDEVNGKFDDVLGFSITQSSTGENATFNELNAGDLVINGTSIGASRASDDTASYSAASSSSKEASGISIAAAINRSSEITGVTAEVNATQVVGSAASREGTHAAGDYGTLYLNGQSISLIDQGDVDANRAHAVSQINAISGQTGVVAEDNGSSLTLTAADGRNIVLALDTNATNNGDTNAITASQFGLGGSAITEADFAHASIDIEGIAGADTVATTTYSTITLSSAGAMEISGGTNGNAALEGLGLKAGTFGGGEAGQFLNEIDISTQKGANAALAAIDNALASVNAARADLGAIQNRFETTISNLALNSENLSAANSRILDADFAAETAAMSRSQIMQQAGISILSQANAAPNQILSLLQ